MCPSLEHNTHVGLWVLTQKRTVRLYELLLFWINIYEPELCTKQGHILADTADSFKNLALDSICSLK